MSSTTFYLFSAPLEGHRLRLCVIPTPAGSVESCAYTRSFVLMALAEAHSTMEQRSAMFPFVAEPEWYRDPWMRKHVKDYVESTESAYDLNNVPVKGPDKGFARAWKAIGKAQEKLPPGADHALPIRNALHTIRHYWIDVVLTDPRWASHLEPWKLWDSASYDSWSTDQKSKRTSLKSGQFGRSSVQFALECPNYAYPPGLEPPPPPRVREAAPVEAKPAGELTRADTLKALIPGHRVKTVAKVLDLKPLTRSNELLIADIVAATSDASKVDSKTATRLMAAANQQKRTKKDFLEAFAVPEAPGAGE